jgi:hypothetical protein
MENNEIEAKAMIFYNGDPEIVPGFSLVSKAPELVEDMKKVLEGGNITSLALCEDGSVFIYGILDEEGSTD